MTEYQTRSNGRIQILQYKFVETKRPTFFFMKDRKKITWLDVPKPYVDTIPGQDRLQELHGTVNTTNTDLKEFVTRWPNIYEYLREVYGPQQYLLEEEQRRYFQDLEEKKEYKYRYNK